MGDIMIAYLATLGVLSLVKVMDFFFGKK